jgi:hypothetical protein
VRVDPLLVKIGERDPGTVDDPDLTESELALGLGVVGLGVTLVVERASTRSPQADQSRDDPRRRR